MYAVSAAHLLMTLRYAASRVLAAVPLAEAVGQCMSDLVGGKDDCALRIDEMYMDRPWTDPPFAWMVTLLLSINVSVTHCLCDDMVVGAHALCRSSSVTLFSSGELGTRPRGNPLLLSFQSSYFQPPPVSLESLNNESSMVSHCIAQEWRLGACDIPLR